MQRFIELLKAFIAFILAGQAERRRRDEIARRARTEAETEVDAMDADDVKAELRRKWRD